MEDTALEGQIEFGKFDLNRLPVLWKNVEPDKVTKTMRALERTKSQQVKELNCRKKSAAKSKNECKDVDEHRDSAGGITLEFSR